MLIWKNISRRRVQSVLTITITLLTVMVFVMVMGVLKTMSTGLEMSRERLGADAILVPKDASATGSDLLFTALPENIYMRNEVYEQAKADYTRTQSAYAAFADANLNLTTARAQAKLDDLQNEMQLAYGIYSQMANQLQLVRAKIQETTPVYTIIESATVPERATSPRKMFLVVAIVFLAALGTTGWILFKKFLQ